MESSRSLFDGGADPLQLNEQFKLLYDGEGAPLQLNEQLKILDSISNTMKEKYLLCTRLFKDKVLRDDGNRVVTGGEIHDLSIHTRRFDRIISDIPRQYSSLGRDRIKELNIEYVAFKKIMDEIEGNMQIEEK